MATVSVKKTRNSCEKMAVLTMLLMEKMAVLTILLMEKMAVLTMLLMLNATATSSDDKQFMTKFSHTLRLQEVMEDKLASMFEELFQNYTAASYPNTFMYICDNNCVSQNTYGSGLTSAFLIAVLSERKFSIFPNINTQFYGFYNEAGCKWKTKMEQLQNKSHSPMIPPSLSKGRYLSDLQIISKRLSIMDFDLHFKADIVHLDGDHDWILDLRRHSRTVIKLPWLFKTHAADLIRLVHNGLFPLPISVRHVIKNEMLTKVGDKKLACFHGNQNDDYQLKSIFEFINVNFYNDYKFYMNIDEKLSGISKTVYQNIIENQIRIDWTEMYRNIIQISGDSETGNGMLRNVLEMHVLKMCDALIVSESASGILAAQLRRKEDNLYCHRNGVIFPCTRKLIARSFRDESNLPKPIDMVYFCNRNDTECITKRN